MVTPPILYLILEGSTLKYFVCFERYFRAYSNWAFMTLISPNSKWTLRHKKTKTVNQFQYPWTKQGQAPQRTPIGE